MMTYCEQLVSALKTVPYFDVNVVDYKAK